MGLASSRRDAGPGVLPEAVRAGAAELGVSLTAQQAERLTRFASLLVRWNAVHNLTTIAEPGQVLTHHLLDSLAILPSIDRIFGEKQISVLDVGSGGGLPGVPLAIARPEWRVTLLDKVEKKVAFLTQARLELGLSNVECRHARAEDLRECSFDLVVSRAFASLRDFVGVTRHLLARGGWWAAMKGQVPTGELADLRQAFPQVQVADIVTLDVPRLGAERHLILLQQH